MEQNPVQKNTLMGVLAYLGPLVIISYAMAKDDPFVKFHIKQGVVLLIISVILWFLDDMWYYSMIFNLLNLVLFILAIIGIVNVVKGQEKELPLVGSLARNLNF